MTVQFARIRIARIKTDMCYSSDNLYEKVEGKNINKDNKEDTSEIINWFEIK